MPPDLYEAFALYATETEKLEVAYHTLQEQFFVLKQQWESSHYTLQQIVTHMGDGLLLVTREGTIALCNPAAAHLFGYQVEALSGVSFWEVFPDSLFGFSLRELLASTTPPRKRLYLSLCGEKEMEISTSWIPSQGLLLLLSSGYERKQLDRSLDQTERFTALGEMATGLAHEIRNPLGSMIGFAQLLERELPDISHQRMAHAIVEGAYMLHRLVAQVLDYTRPLSMHFVKADIVALLYEVVYTAKISTDYPTCQLTTCVENDHLFIDVMQIKLVLFNLLRNAAEAGATLVELSLEPDHVLLIRDNGEGIPEANIKKIFAPFFTTKEKGNGLGLARSLAIVKAHGGTLEVTSKPGESTIFTLQLPGGVEHAD